MARAGRPTMFAEFEKTSNELAESGEPLTHENLTGLYLELNKKYYGEDMVSDELIGYVDRREGRFVDDPNVVVIDLPGTYSLRATNPDEKVARDVVLGKLG